MQKIIILLIIGATHLLKNDFSMMQSSDISNFPCNSITLG